MRYTLPKLRKEAWKALIHPETTIKFKRVGNPSALGYSSDESGGVEIYIDPYKVNTRSAVIHELLHVILDKHFRGFATYEVYEYWITSLESPFFNRVSRKERDKWRKAIEAKMPESQKPKQLSL